MVGQLLFCVSWISIFFTLVFVFLVTFQQILVVNVHYRPFLVRWIDFIFLSNIFWVYFDLFYLSNSLWVIFSFGCHLSLSLLQICRFVNFVNFFVCPTILLVFLRLSPTSLSSPSIFLDYFVISVQLVLLHHVFFLFWFGEVGCFLLAFILPVSVSIITTTVNTNIYNYSYK